MTTPQCPICYPPTFMYDPPAEGLMPDACPARDNHETIKRAFVLLWWVEAQFMTVAAGCIELSVAARVRADIERLRTARQTETEQGKADEISMSARKFQHPYW